MRGRFSTVVGVALLVLVALLALVTLPGVASAATALADGQWVNPTGSQPSTVDYSVRTTRPYWSVVVLRPGYIQTSDPNVDAEYHLQVPGGASSANANKIPDWVAIDGNVRSPQDYTARVVRYKNTWLGEQYGITFQDGRSVLPPGRTIVDAPDNGQPNNVYIRDVWLGADTMNTIFVGGYHVTCPEPGSGIGTLYLNAYLLGSDPANPASGVQSRASALVRKEGGLLQNWSSCGYELQYMVSRAGWYGVLVIDRAFPQVIFDVRSVPIPIIS